ncbi:hypothetical protein F4861DRAFT_501580 [Xylaria intraflava]|nr:hypothetical protein F4861DRAFT_501580 [Xylaria intraflava]
MLRHVRHVLSLLIASIATWPQGAPSGNVISTHLGHPNSGSHIERPKHRGKSKVCSPQQLSLHTIFAYPTLLLNTALCATSSGSRPSPCWC